MFQIGFCYCRAGVAPLDIFHIIITCRILVCTGIPIIIVTVTTTLSIEGRKMYIIISTCGVQAEKIIIICKTTVSFRRIFRLSVNRIFSVLSIAKKEHRPNPTVFQYHHRRPVEHIHVK